MRNGQCFDLSFGGHCTMYRIRAKAPGIRLVETGEKLGIAFSSLRRNMWHRTALGFRCLVDGPCHTARLPFGRIHSWNHG